MAAKSILVLCASVCLVKVISAQCIGAMNALAGTALAAEELALSNAYGANTLAYGAGLSALGAGPFGYGPAAYNAAVGYGLPAAPSSGGGFAVTSSSPIAPTGITVISENAIEGPLSITGQLPFLGAIALEGALPTAGAGAINYGCGTGAVGIVSEGLAGPVGPPAYGPALGYPANVAAGIGYPGLPGPRPFNGLPGLGNGLGAGLGYGAMY